MTQVTNPQGKIWIALKNRVSDWNETGVKMMMPSEIYEPQPDEAYVIVQNVTTETGFPLPLHVACGVPFQGFLNLSVMVPFDWGYDAHIGLAGRVADHFPNNARYAYSDIAVRVNGRSKVIGGVALNEPWNRLEVQVPWVAWG